MRAIGHQRLLLSIIMLSIVSVMLLSVVTVFHVTDVMQQQLAENAAQRIELNLRLAEHALSEFGGPVRLLDGRLYAGDTLLEGNATLVHDIQNLSDSEVALFRSNELVATTLPLLAPPVPTSPGSMLFPQAAQDAVLAEGRAYRDIITIMGKPHFVGYAPVKSADKKVIGALFVGFDEAGFTAGLLQMRTTLVTISIIAFCALGLAFTLFLDRILWKLQKRSDSLAQTSRLLDAALESINQGICFIGTDQALILANRRYAEIYGLPKEVLKPGTTFQKIAETRRHAGTGPRDAEAHHQTIIEHVKRGVQAGEMVTELQNGQIIEIRYRHIDSGSWVATHEDITERRLNAASFKSQTHYDALTGLPNRVMFMEHLAKALATSGERVAVHCIDLDQFKAINDTLGYAIGDKLLQGVAARITACLSNSDIIARLSGDEFAIIQCHLRCVEDAEELARRILHVVAKPYDFDRHQVKTALSVGIAVSPDDAVEVDHLLIYAGMALQSAKRDGRATYRLYDSDMAAAQQLRRTLELDLRLAVEREQLELYYQPMLDITSSEVIGLEALLRWRHPHYGMIPPIEFIPLAEESGLIIPIGAWVIQQACKEATAWPEHIGVSVNVSPVQFKGNKLVFNVEEALAITGLAPHRLELEITESILLQNNDVTLTILNRLHELGVRVALDDFGTGYASLGYLRNFLFDTLKIDQSFVRDLSENANCLTIVHAITGLGRDLGLRVLAEGVETGPQLDTLRRAGCHSAQGYLFSRPKPAGEILAMLSQKSAA